MRRNGARTLLMGGQACVFYGAAEFSRDLDLLLPLEDGLEAISAALAAQEAEQIAVPAFAAQYLERGHAVHFRCRAADTRGLRIDLMARLRGVEPFAALWERRTVIEVAGEPVAMLALADLVQAKKTQRDKDWPMRRRLMERSYVARTGDEGEETTRFWLQELTTPELLIEVASTAPQAAARVALQRPAVAAALQGDAAAVASALAAEQARERDADRRYWEPLKRELEQLRHPPAAPPRA